MGRIPEEYLSPKELWPSRVYTLPEFHTYPERLNSTEELLDKAVARGWADRVAMYYEDKAITYRVLQRQVNRLGSRLKALGIEEADRVAIRSLNIPPAIVANFAIIKIGAISLPLSALFSRAEIAHVLNNAEAKALIVMAPLLEEVEKARGEFQTVRHIIVIGGKRDEIRQKGYLSYEELIEQGDDELEPVRRDRMDVSVLLYTSGTTGPPKGTVHFMEEALIVPDTFGKYGWRVKEDDVIGGPAPLAMAAGYSTVAVIPYRFGAAVSLIPRFTPEGMFETIQKHRITILSALPTAYRKMLQVPEAEKRYDLRSLRTCTGGGESLTAQTYHDWKAKFGMEIYEGLGTTEMMYVFISSASTRKVKPGAIGTAIPGYALKVVNEEGNACSPGEVGMLLAQGPTGTLYWRDLEKQRQSVREGWCRIGDMVSMDEEGYIWFLAREDDLIKSSGYRIGPEEIEDVLVKHPAVADAGVIGVPDPVRGQNTKAFVVLQEGYEPSEAMKEELLAFCRERIAIYKLPREIEFIKELPRTITGKLLRRILREREEKQHSG